MDPGKFIVLEGIDGSGTSTQAKLLASYLFGKDKKNIIVLTREPTQSNEYGIKLRRWLRKDFLPQELEEKENPELWANLFICDRQWHLDHIVVPAVLSGQQVISDRHKLSTIAYQSAQAYQRVIKAGKSAGEANKEMERCMDELIRRHQGMYTADLTLLLTVTPEAARERGLQEQREPEYFDHLGFQQQVQENYVVAARKLTAGQHHYLDRAEKIVILDGSGSVEEVAELVRKEADWLY